jgi:protein tyrosine phosphatase
MVERQMRQSILMVGSFWYSAWVDAGQPNMRNLIRNTQTLEEKKKIQEEEKLYQNGKAIGRPET